MSKLANRPAVLKYLKKNCKGFDEKRIFITHKHDGKFQLVVALDDKTLHAEEFWDASWAIDLLIPRVEGYLKDGYWDKDAYYQPYMSDPKDVTKNISVGPVLRFVNYNGSKDNSKLMKDFRAEHPDKDLGFKEVPPTKSAVYYT